MAYLGDYDLSTLVYGKFTTYRPSTGAAFTLGGTPALSVYKDNSVTQSTTGVTLVADFDSVTGLNHFTIDTSSDGTFYSAGAAFSIVITTGTVDSVSVVGSVVAEFSIRKDSALKPTVAARTLDVSAGGEAGLDWANIGSPTTTVNLSGTTVATVTNQLTAASIATGVWQDATAGDFTTASSIGKSLYTGNVAPGGTGGLFIAGSNAATTIAGLTTGALACTTVTVSGAVAFQSTFAITSNFSIGGTATFTGAITATAANDIRGVLLQKALSAAMDELSGVPAAGPTAGAALEFIFMALRNLRETTATTDIITNNSGATIATATLSDDTVTFSKGEYA